MDIQIDPHTLERAEERGTNADEIRDVILNGKTFGAKGGRLAKSKVYEFKQQRLGQYYYQKRVEVIYAIENNVAITVTAYVYYGRWEREDANHL